VQVTVGGVRFRADSFERPETGLRLVVYEGDHGENRTIIFAFS